MGNGNALDDCRNLIADMGNVIALVRMIRAAKRKIESDEMQFLLCNPRGIVMDKESSIQLQDLNNEYSLSTDAFFCMIPALTLCFVEASLKGKEIMHKMNLTRDGYFSDDGFSVGLSFVLSTLGQLDQYNSLNWRQSVEGKYSADEEDLESKKRALEAKRNAKAAAAKQSWFSTSTGAAEEDTEYDDEETILNMISKKLEGNRRELAVFFFSMNKSFLDNK